MNIKRFFKRYLFQFVILFVFSIPLLFLIHDNWQKAAVIFSFLLIWFFVSFKTKSVVQSSLLYILITLPLNLTYQLSSPVPFFNTDPYVNGMYTNYLVPTVSILDIGLILLLVSYLYEFGLKHTKIVLQRYRVYMVLFLVFLLAQSMLKLSLVSLIGSFRLVASLCVVLLLVDYFRMQKKTEIWKWVLLSSFLSVLIQGIIGVLQFSGGSSLGLPFLGESQVVSGMQGSSFVTLNNEVFLRAYGTFPHPNILGGYLVMNVLLGTFLYSKRRGFYKILTISLIISSSIFVTFTFSRICILLVLLILCVTALSKLLTKKMFSFAPILLIGERFTNLLSGGDTSWMDRVNLMKSSFNIIKNNWLFGTGLGNFTKAMEGDIPRTVNNVLLVQPVHNIFFLTVSELGVMGTLLYALLLGKILINNIRVMNVFKWLVVLTFIIIGCFDHYLFSLPQGGIIASILLLMVVL